MQQYSLLSPSLPITIIVSLHSSFPGFTNYSHYLITIIILLRSSCHGFITYSHYTHCTGNSKHTYIPKNEIALFPSSAFMYLGARAGHSLIFSWFAIRSPLNFFPWIADAHAFIF
jgi:hypothetical protein